MKIKMNVQYLYAGFKVCRKFACPKTAAPLLNKKAQLLSTPDSRNRSIGSMKRMVERH